MEIFRYFVILIIVFYTSFCFVSSLTAPAYRQLPKPVGSNDESSFVELLLVTDLVQVRHQDLEKAQQRLRVLATYLNHAMQSLNIFVYLNDRNVVNAGNVLNITSSDTVKSALAKFSHFVVDSKNRFGVFDHAMLISGNRLRNEDGDVQMSYLGGICWLDSSVSIVTDYRSAVDIRELVSAMAYALARNLGIEDDYHDRVHECVCHKRPCVMSSYKRRMSFVEWSSCSRSYLKRAQLLGRHYCLNNLPRMAVSHQKLTSSTVDVSLFTKRTYPNENRTSTMQNDVFTASTNEEFFSGNGEYSLSPMMETAQPTVSRCGNGFVEPGEQCDGGLPEFVSPEEMACCDPLTCKLTGNATCASGDCCDLATCQFKERGTACRPEANECDLPEFCSGSSEYCPVDVFKQSGVPCSSQALCHEGMCRSLSLQCRRIFGETAFPASASFWFSNMPPLTSSDFGCGNGIPCANDSDIECGRLFCQHEAEKPVLFYAPPHWREDLPKADGGFLPMPERTSATESPNLSLFVTHRTETRAGNRAVREASYVVVNPMPGTVDPGFVEDGTPCGGLVGGEAKGVCFNHVCVFDKRQHKCDSQETCSGHGVCNNVDSCHCDPGFAPPFCNSSATNVSGNGGSLQSGPPPATLLADDVSYNETIIIIVSFLFAIILIGLAVVGFIFRRKLQIWYYSRKWSGSSSHGATTSRVPAILGRNSALRINLSKVQRKWGSSIVNKTPAKHNCGREQCMVASEPRHFKIGGQNNNPPRRSFRGLEISTPVLQHSTRRDLDTLMSLGVVGQTLLPASDPSESATSPMLTGDGYSEDEKTMNVNAQSPDLIQSTYLPSSSSNSNNTTLPSFDEEHSEPQQQQRDVSLPKRPAPRTPQQNPQMHLKGSFSVPEHMVKNKLENHNA